MLSYDLVGVMPHHEDFAESSQRDGHFCGHDGAVHEFLLEQHVQEQDLATEAAL